MKKQETKAWKILEFIGSKGKEGASFKEIQFYIWTVLDGKSVESFYEMSPIRIWNKKQGRGYDSQARQSRGHWCTALYGGMHYHSGLLSYCRKNKDNKWVLEYMPAPGTNIYKFYLNGVWTGKYEY